jgi:hypothetical protein
MCVYYRYTYYVIVLQAVVEDDPDYVVRRFESGRYAVDSESRRIYQRALELVEVCVVMHQ